MPWETQTPNGQELADIAQLLGDEWEARRMDEPELSLDTHIREWVWQFCVLHGWAVPECGPPIHKRIRELIVNRT